MDIVERLRKDAKDHLNVAHEGDCDPKSTVNYKHYQNNLEAADEIERLRNNAKQDAQYLLAYHRICQKHGIAPASSDLIEALKEKE